jgi:hypothetical protein
MTFDRVLVRPRSSDDAQFGRIVLVPEGMIALNAAVEETVRALFGGALVAELTDDEVNAAVAGDRSRTVSNLKIQKTLAAPSTEPTSELPAWVPLHRIAAERARLEACPIKVAQRAIIKAAGEGAGPGQIGDGCRASVRGDSDSR